MDIAGKFAAIYWHFRAAPLVTCRLELRQLLASWEAELGRHAPALAVLHVPRLWAADSAPDISALFPARTAVVTCMESLLGAQTNLGRTELQALLFSDDLRFRYLYNLSYIPLIPKSVCYQRGCFPDLLHHKGV